MKTPSFQYSGNHEQHPPDSKVISVVTDTLRFFQTISARVEYFDVDNRYDISFAWEGKVFLKVTSYAGHKDCWVEDTKGWDSKKKISTWVPFTCNELQCRLIPLLLDPVLEAREKDIQRFRHHLMALRDPEDRKEI